MYVRENYHWCLVPSVESPYGPPAFAPVLFALQSHATCHRSLIVCRRWFIVFEIHLSHLRVRFADKLFETLRVSHWCVPDLRD